MKLKRKLKMAITKKAPMSSHSPAGRKELKRKKKKPEQQAVYFKNIKRKTDIQRLKDAGVSVEDLRALGYTHK